MASLKQRLELAAVRLADAKNMLAAAQKEFDELFRLASDRGAKGAKAKPASPPPVEAVPQGRIKDLVAQILLQARCGRTATRRLLPSFRPRRRPSAPS